MIRSTIRGTGIWNTPPGQTAGGRNVFKIRLEDDVFVTDNTHVVDTKIHIAFHNHCFPCDTWTDFTFPILEEWKMHLVQAKDRCDTSFQFYFHDGPFMMKVHKDHAMMLTVDCIRDANKIEFTFNCGYYDFLRALYHAMKHFAKILFANNMNVGAFSSVYRQTLLSIDELKKLICDDRQTV